MVRQGTRSGGLSRVLHLLGAAAVILAATSGLFGPAPACPVQTGPAIPTATFPDGRSFLLEIARTPKERALGYMFREEVGPREGMLFLFPGDDFHSIWMKNCKVSLDLVWLSEGLTVVHLEERVPPCRHDPCPGYFPMRKARLVLEIKAGMAGKAGLRVGDLVRLEGVELTAPSTP